MKRSDLLLAAVAASLALGVTATLAKDRPGRDAAEIFERLDADGDGLVTGAEVASARDARFGEMDADGDGSVTLSEFTAHAQAQSVERATRMFERLDADGDGVLSRDALEARRGRGPGPEMIDRLDADSDGAVSLEEFEAGMDRFAKRFQRRGDGFRNRRN